MRVLVTGSNGFVGRALIPALAAQGYSVRTVTRRFSQAGATDNVAVNNIDGRTDWSAALAEIDCVVHLAARAHVMRDTAADPLSTFRSVNVAGTERLASQAVRAGVKRFVFLSSAKVNGEQTKGIPYRETDEPSPTDAYAISKWEAEQVLRRVGQDTGLEVVVLRPPLVYGPEVKANFRRMLDLIDRGWPLPFGRVDNCRSFVFVGNLVDAVTRCVSRTEAKGQTFLVSDGQDISTPDLIRHLSGALDKPERLVSIPPALLALAARALGRVGELNRLTTSLQVDSSHIRRTLAWTPPYSMETGLNATADWYRGLTGH